MRDLNSKRPTFPFFNRARAFLLWVTVSSLTLVLTGCYTIAQGYYQTKLILKRRSIDDVLKEKNEKPDRLEKLKIVPAVLEFARQEIGLTTGKSYQSYIGLEGPSVTYVVQAAEKRRLKFKTWWFPIVGRQPYLGFFVQKDAAQFRQKMVDQCYDTTLGGVQAFSLLGYFPDPVYSSMLDNKEIPDIVEVLIHENVHRTLYVPQFYTFNENLADFVAKRATVLFLEKHPELKQDIKKYQETYSKTIAAQGRFKEFLIVAKKQIEDFYSEAEKDPRWADETLFLEERKKKFDALAEAYQKHMNGIQEGTGYAWAFRKGYINNATILGYSLYEARQTPFEKALENAQGNLKTFLQNLAVCFNTEAKNEAELWQRVENCKGS